MADRDPQDWQAAANGESGPPAPGHGAAFQAEAGQLGLGQEDQLDLDDHSAGQAALEQYYRHKRQEPPAWAALTAQQQAEWDCIGLLAQVPGRFAPLARLARRALPVIAGAVAAVALVWLLLAAVSHGGG